MPLRLGFGDGQVLLGEDGTPAAFAHRADTARRYLLDAAQEPWHGPDHAWGTGFVITPEGAGRWQAPRGVEWRDDGVTTHHQPLPDLSLTIDRRVDGDHYAETYTWTNRSGRDQQLSGLGINVPIHDVYAGAATALRTACHAHVFPGGAWSWILAEPMSGTPPLLGVVVTEGELWAYSVESRNQGTSSDVRGHLLVHPTDHARNPAAFGGQPVLTLAPGTSYTLTWRLGWYADRDEFLQAVDPPVRLPGLTAPVGDSLRIDLEPGTRVLDVDGTTRGAVSCGDHGVHHIDVERDGRRSRTAAAFLSPVQTLVEARVACILREHRPIERSAPDRHAFVPVDTRTGLRQTENGWGDWSDGAERTGMAVLLQQARRRGWGDSDELDGALAGFAEFARRRLIAVDGSVRRGSSRAPYSVRLYNTPWLAHFFQGQHALYRDAADLDLAATLLESAYALGAHDHLLIGLPEAVVAVADDLDAVGQPERAAAVRRALVDHARRFADLGSELPAHEVSYEQSMVAPLVSLLAIAFRLCGDEALLPSLRTATRWLRAFGGPQPHVRLRDIGIRHWDGFWFGIDRQWGDTFPHYWSVLTALALDELPASERPPDTETVVRAIFAANLVDFGTDGRATCAFVLPSCVDGRPAHRADPLANDQDWALALLLRSGAA